MGEAQKNAPVPLTEGIIAMLNLQSLKTGKPIQSAKELRDEKSQQ